LYAGAVSLSLLAAGIVMPFAGALSDHLGRRMGLLIPSTALCIVFTAFLSIPRQLPLALILFAAAHFFYQVGLVFYDAMLPQMSHASRMGRLSGFGIALGYVGTLIGLVLVRPFVARGGNQAAFLPTAFFFFLFSLPCFLGVSDPAGPLSKRPLPLLQEGLRRIKEGMRAVKESAPLRGLFSVFFFASLGIQPVVYFMSVYAKEVVGLTDSQLFLFFIVATTFTILGSYGLGFLTDRFGPRLTLALSLGGWLLGLGLALLPLSPELFFGVGSLVGIAMGGSWLSLRVLAVHLSPREHLAQVLGFLGLAARSAAVAGPLLWGVTTSLLRGIFPLNYRLAVFQLLIFLCVAYILLIRKIPETRP